KEQFGYTIDPHGAVSYLALKTYLQQSGQTNVNAAILETAHPSKFSETVDEVLKEKTTMPERLSACLEKEKRSVLTQKDYASFKEALIKTIT
ncbi:MAG: threonine synthase, partial [Ignavibacteria bacterium]|nr:threonine synthase [Ignavibacteria bacterium]